METVNILCEKKNQIMLNDLFEDFRILLQDSDATEEKEKVKNSFKKMADNTAYLVLGEEGAGKTSLLNALFQEMTSFSDEFSGEICEYRWGEQELTTSPVDGVQKKFVTMENMRGISIVDTKGINRFTEESRKKVKEQIERSSAVFVVFAAEHIRSPKLWDVLEGCPQKRMIFFLTKCDLLSEKDLHSNVEKLKNYMEESGIFAPLFPISHYKETTRGDIVAIDEARAYIRDNVVGKNPMLNRQMENVAEMKRIIVQLKESFALRKQQYVSDFEILQKINCSLDTYMLNHKRFLDTFIGKVAAEINKDIDNYEREIISKLDPYKIKERFQKREDFEDYLNLVNENYKTMMSDSINRKTIEAIKSCLHGLESVFKEATGYFNKRENILVLNDKFYGTLSTSRRKMSDESREMVVSTGELYRTLNGASETLFMQIWNERKKYDDSIRKHKALSNIGGGIAGGATGVAIGAGTGAMATFLSGIGVTGAAAGAAGTAGVTAGTAGAMAGTAGAMAGTTGAMAGTAGAMTGTAGVTAGTVGAAAGTAGVVASGIVVFALVAIGIIGGAALFRYISKSFFDPKTADKMEANTRKCIEQFKNEVDHTRIEMIEQVTRQIITIFENELANVDNCFAEFRMSVNIDEKKIPLLERRMQEAEDLLMKIESI